MRAGWRAPAALALAVAALAGCAIGPRTTVVLMPDQDGHVGSVVVTGREGAQVIDRAFDGVSVAAKGVPSAPASIPQPMLDAGYKDLLAAQPPRPASFTLHFVLDSSELTEESKARIPEVIAAARERAPTEVTVYGHADAVGTERRNSALSIERARVVARLLLQAAPGLGPIDVQGYGDSEPLPGTAAHGADPRNRRAEVVIL
jgi:outer membrane protein OmpA-like peptidoglycan-associated protein